MYLSFETAYYKYLEYIDNRQKEQSKLTLKERFKNHILPFFKDYNIYEINDSDYLSWQKWIEEKKLSNNLKKGLHYLMCGFYNYLINYLEIKNHIPRRVGSFKEIPENKKYQIYSLKEFNKFIKFIDNEIYKQFFIFLYFCGTRPGEAMAITFKDLEYKRIFINKTISEHSINGKRIINTPKTRSSNRKIDIDKKLYKSLLNLKKHYIKIYKEEFNENFYIFGGKYPLAPTTINRYKKKACQKANLNPIKLHEFRHSHASLLYEKNIPIKAIKERLGHGDINTTIGIYIHLSRKKEKRVLRTLNFLRLIY